MENIILTSSVISAIISASIAGIVSLRTKKVDYKFTYYKEILTKRLNAYQFLEAQIAVLKSVVVDDDSQPYHMILTYGYEKFLEFQQNLLAAISYSLWINEATVTVMEELNDMFYYLNSEPNRDNESLIELGKRNYKEISRLRKELESCVRRDLLELYDLEKFLKRKTSGNTRLMKKYK